MNPCPCCHQEDGKEEESPAEKEEGRKLKRQNKKSPSLPPPPPLPPTRQGPSFYGRCTVVRTRTGEEEVFLFPFFRGRASLPFFAEAAKARGNEDGGESKQSIRLSVSPRPLLFFKVSLSPWPARQANQPPNPPPTPNLRPSFFTRCPHLNTATPTQSTAMTKRAAQTTTTAAPWKTSSKDPPSPRSTTSVLWWRQVSSWDSWEERAG